MGGRHCCVCVSAQISTFPKDSSGRGLEPTQEPHLNLTPFSNKVTSHIRATRPRTQPRMKGNLQLWKRRLREETKAAEPAANQQGSSCPESCPVGLEPQLG